MGGQTTHQTPGVTRDRGEGRRENGEGRTVVPSPTSPHCQTPNSRLEIPQQELVRLEDEQINDAIQVRTLWQRMAEREPRIRQLAARLFGGS